MASIGTWIQHSKSYLNRHLELKQQKELSYNPSAAIFWYRDSNQSIEERSHGHTYKTRIVNDNEFSEVFKRRGNDPIWKEIYYIQTVVKAAVSIGKWVIINFTAPVNHKSQEDEINYNFRAFKEDKHLSLKEICLKIICKIWYYVQIMYRYEV